MIQQNNLQRYVSRLKTIIVEEITPGHRSNCRWNATTKIFFFYLHDNGDFHTMMGRSEITSGIIFSSKISKKY